ncbi:hypothetical protein HNQ59_002402 [Chitinivorax tropicus]|uniref:Immunity protein 72 domain-containing protein n=1 Tax=Chitinivorax tropicus TaxID=714531 RepID=A0A840MIS2_9PROT|nr:Imm72 family immunity protein [Chitinivorax tropicus]MBB5019104.1 hypothetical protein [Chitinivorax tropicus]
MAFYTTAPTEAERPVLFRILKQQSSLTIWQQIVPYYSAWVDEIVRSADLRVELPDWYETYLGPDRPRDKEMFSQHDIVEAMTLKAALVDAVDKLRRGDRSVFLWRGYFSGQGYICEARRLLSSWATQIRRYGSGEVDFTVESDHWPPLERLYLLTEMAMLNGVYVLQTRCIDDPAPLDTFDVFKGDGDAEAGRVPTHLTRLYRHLMAIKEQLPPVPVPKEEVLVKTGHTLPCTGIWEPVKVDLSAGFLGLFQRPQIPADGVFEPDGCMNYLHGGARAPTVEFEEEKWPIVGKPTVWRLLWKDERYLDGTVPDEEKDYVFAVPGEPWVRRYEPQPGPPPPAEHGLKLITARTGEAAIESGYWAAQEHIEGRTRVNKGERLPDYRGKPVTWVYTGLK